MKLTLLLHIAVISLLSLATTLAQAYPVGPALPLEKLAAEADLICKAEVVESKPLPEDAFFTKTPGFRPLATKLKVIAIYQGDRELKECQFRHYALDDKGMGFNFQPQFYDLVVGRTYLIFAKKVDGKAEYRQLWKNHKALEDQGVILAADQVARTELPLAEVIWQELTGLTKKDEVKDVEYGLRHLDAMSGGDYRELADLDRRRVLSAVAPLMRHKEPAIAKQAINVMSSHNPLMSSDFAPGWLATVGKGHIPGYSAWDSNKEYLGGKLYWKELAAMVDSQSPVELRELAARALGRGGAVEVLPLAEKWVRDPEAKVRRAAAVLMSDYPERANTQRIKELATDVDPIARRGAAEAIGFGQFQHLVEELGALVDDRDPQVSAAAALSLLSFSLDHSEKTLKEHLNHPQYQPLFVNALAKADTESYLKQLCAIVREKKEPSEWWGGFVPWGDSWQLLFHYVQRQPAATIKAGKLDDVLEALEYPVSGDAKGPTFYSSSEPRDLYALYVQRGLKDRAAKFRATAKKAITYDIDYYFNMVDQNPQQYQRQ